MRFFRPALSPAKSYPIIHTFKTGVVQGIYISEDLAKLQVHCKKKVGKQRNEIQLCLKNSLNDFPLPTYIRNKDGLISVTKLPDIKNSLAKVIGQLKVEDPIFLQNLDYYFNSMDEMEDNDLPSNGGDIESDFLKLSHLRCQYFVLQGLRGNGNNHAVELPLKRLQNSGFISQEALNEILVSVWCRVSELRKLSLDENSQAKVVDFPQPDIIPNSFSPRK